jgi:hypothetical protein
MRLGRGVLDGLFFSNGGLARIKRILKSKG